MERAASGGDEPMRAGSAVNVSDSEETPAAAEARRAAGASNVGAGTDTGNGNGNDDDELDDFALSSGDEGGDAAGKEPALDRAMMNELLLVCSNLGMLRVQNEGEEPVLMRGEDCEEWIHDLQRAIRRDHAKYKLVAKQLGKWKILQKKLLPLLLNHQHDWSLVFSILKVLVMLTMKPSKESTNIAQQLKYLRAYKFAFLRHDIVPVLMTILVDPLSRKGSARTAQDYLNMELVLTLIRNVLAIPNEDPRFVTSTTTYLSHLQEDFIRTLHEESAYEMILLFAQDIESAENREWNLLIMEMMDLTLDCSHPKAVAAFAKQSLSELTDGGDGTVAGATKTSGAPSAPAAKAVSLAQTLSSEKLAAQKPSGSRRHSNFGGVLTLVGPTGRSTLLTNFAKVADDQVPQAAKKPVARKRGGRQRTGPAADLSEIFSSGAKVTESDRDTMRVLVEICDSLLSKSYFQLTNSLKNEFRRGSSKLVSTDRLQYFHLVWFLTTYHRLKLEAQKSHYRQLVRAHEKRKTELLQNLDFATPAPPAPAKPTLDEKAVLSTLDMFSFNFVLQSIETYASVKNVHGMTVSVQLLTEMMSYLTELHGSDDPRYQRIADSLQHKILYERDFLDRLPVLLKTWSPGTFSKDYVADVVTLTHLVFKMLDSQGNIKVLSRRKALLESKKKKATKKKKSDGDGDDDGDASESDEEEEAERQAQLLLEMQRKEADFDVRRYFQSLLSPDTIKMYCFLLATYRENSARVNHYIHSFFYRAKHFRVVPHENWTMQPLLFNIHVLLLFHRMLQDTAIQRRADLKAFLDFIRGVVRDYFALAERNHLLFVESLLRQPYAAKSALLLQRNYEPLDSMAKSRSEAVALGREKQIALINEVRRQKRAIDAEELEGEEEFQFTLAPADFQASALTVKSAREGGGSDAESDGEAEFGGHEQSAAAAVAPNSQQPTSTSTKTKTKKKAATSRAGTERAKTWTKVEDRYLAKMYRMYRHLPSVYEVISYEDMFQDRDRTAEQIERRVKFLKLHRKTHDSSDEEDDDDAKSKSDNDDRDGSDVEMNAAMVTPRESARPRRRLRRVTVLSDDGSGSEDDLLQQLGGRKPLASASGGSRSPDTATQLGDGDAEVYGAEGEQETDPWEAGGNTNDPMQTLDSGDTATQVIGDDDEDDNGDTQMVEEEDEVVQATASTELSADEVTAASATASEHAEPLLELVDDDASETTVEAAASSNKRARSPVDGDGDDAAAGGGDDLANSSPLKKVARSADAQDSAADAVSED